MNFTSDIITTLFILYLATDKWLFTPLHESAQKSRTHLCALLLAHGADPFAKNQEGHSPIDLAVAEDVRSLLQDAMTTPQSLPVTLSVKSSVAKSPSVIQYPSMSPGASSNNSSTATASGGATVDSDVPVANETVIMPSGNPFLIPIRSLLSSGGGDGEADPGNQNASISSAVIAAEAELKKEKMKAIVSFLCTLSLDHLKDTFER